MAAYWNSDRNADDNGDKTDKINLGELDYLGGDFPGKYLIDQYEYQQEFYHYIESQFGLSRKNFRGNDLHFNNQLINMRYFSILEHEVNRIYREKDWIDADGNLLPIVI